MEFFKRYGDALEVLLEDISKLKPLYVVALARKGPRLLDLCLTSKLGKYIDSSKILSDRSLAFLPPNFFNGAEVCVIDDIAIYGSTLKDVCDTVQQLGGKPLPYAIAINRDQLNTNLFSSHNPPKYVLGLNFKQASTFNNILATNIGYLCKPFDTDHPIATLRINKSEKQIFKELRKKNLEARKNSEAFDGKRAITKFTIDIPSNNCNLAILNPKSTQSSGISKIRLYLEPGRIRIVPMYLFEWDASLGEPFLINQSSALIEHWKSLKALINETQFASCDETTDWLNCRIYRVAHYVAALYLLAFVWRKFNLESIFNLELGELEWDRRDIQYSFGPILSEKMAKWIGSFLTSVPNKIDSNSIPKTSNALPLENLDILQNNELYKDIEEQLISCDFSNKKASDAINTIFNLTYLYHERKERNLRVDRQKRLSIGFSLGDIKTILKLRNITFSDNDISASIDDLVDTGSIVPQFVRTTYNSAHLWRRVYRYGENGFGTPPIKTQYLVAYIVNEIKRQLPRYSKHRKRVSEFLLEKITSSLLISGLYKYRDVSDCQLKWIVDEFGARACPTGRVHEETLLEWGVNVGLFQEFKKDETEKEVIISPDWGKRFPPENSPLDDKELLPEISGFIQAVLAFISSTDKTPHSSVHDERLLALSTCGKQERAIEAIAIVLKLWFRHSQYNAARLFVLWQRFQGGNNTINEIKKTLVHLAKYCRQGENKAQIFKAVKYIKCELDNTFFSGSWFPLEPFAKKYLIHMLNPDLSPENYATMGKLYWFNNALRLFTTYLRALFSDKDLIKDEGVHSLEKTLVSRWEEFAKAIQELGDKYPELRLALTEIPIVVKIDSSKIPLALSKEMLNHAETTFRIIMPAYDSYVSTLKPAKIKTPVANEYVLLYDLKKSSDYAPSERIKLLTNIQEKLERSSGANIKFERSDDDGNWLRIYNVQSVILSVFRLKQFSSEEGIGLRMAICTTKETSPFVDTENTNSGWSTAIPTCARILEHSKSIVKTAQTTTDCLVTEHFRNLCLEIGGLIDAEKFEEVKSLNPSGETLPPIHLYNLNLSEEFRGMPF